MTSEASTFSVFKAARWITLYTGSARPSKIGGVGWKLRRRSSRPVDLEENPVAFEGAGGSTIALGIGPERPFSYLRGTFALQPGDLSQRLRFELDLVLENVPGILVVVALFEDPELTREVHSTTTRIDAADGAYAYREIFELGELAGRGLPLFGFIQVCFTTPGSARIHIGRYAIVRGLLDPNYRRLRVRCDLDSRSGVGASRFVELLRQEEHEVFLSEETAGIDLLICSTGMFDTLATVRAASPEAVIVCELGDGEAEAALRDFLPFANQSDVVLCRNEEQAQAVRPWHANVHVPGALLDATAQSPCRTATGRLGRTGCLAVEGAVLPLVASGEIVPVSLSARDDEKAFERELSGFDLLLLPDAGPDHTDSILTALALGVPVLAARTPASEHLAGLVGLHPSLLVSTQDGWDAAIARIAENFEEIERSTLAARDTLLKNLSVRAAVVELFAHLAETTRLGGRATLPTPNTSPELKKIDVLIVDSAAKSHVQETLTRSAVDWTAFNAVTSLSTADLPAEEATSGFPYMDLFSRADVVVAKSKAKYLLVIPSGTVLAHGWVAEASRIVRESETPITLFARSAYMSSELVGDFGTNPLQELLKNVMVPGPLLIRTKWLRQDTTRWTVSYEYWSWVLLVRAIATDVLVDLVELPLAFEANSRDDRDVPRQLDTWLRNGHGATEVSDSTRQWHGVFADLLADAVVPAGADLPAAYGDVYARYAQSLRDVEALKRELARMKDEVEES
jgi:hypothetical protein